MNEQRTLAEPRAKLLLRVIAMSAPTNIRSYVSRSILCTSYKYQASVTHMNGKLIKSDFSSDLFRCTHPELFQTFTLPTQPSKHQESFQVHRLSKCILPAQTIASHCLHHFLTRKTTLRFSYHLLQFMRRKKTIPCVLLWIVDGLLSIDGLRFSDWRLRKKMTIAHAR
jgi:hypothetical protein